MRLKIAAGREKCPLIRVFIQRSKKPGKPAALVTVCVRSGPDTELFHVVAHGSHAARVDASSVAQIGDDVFDFAKRNEITQSFLPGVKPYRLATVFGDVGSKEFFRFEPRGKKMHVIDERVGDVGGGQGGGKLGLPNTLGEPGTGRKPAEVFLEIGSQTRNLLALIFGRNRDQDRFIEAAADQFHLAGLDQLFQANEILWPMFLDPGEKRPGIVEAETNSRVLFEVL